MSEVKRIFTDIFPPIEHVERENERTKVVISELLNRFKSEENTNTLEYAMTALEFYCYVPLKYRLWPGRYARYLNTSDALHMSLKLGGFVISDNGYTVTLANGGRTFRVDKRKAVWFMTIIENDEIRIRMNEFI
jgi:hypothetical protein